MNYHVLYCDSKWIILNATTGEIQSAWSDKVTAYQTAKDLNVRMVPQKPKQELLK